MHEITLNGTAIDPAGAFADGRIALAGLADRNELRVVADCRYSSDGTGLHRAVDSADGKVYTYTKFEPAYARRVFANFEQPDLKAAFTFHVTVPGHWTVLSNQPAIRLEPSRRRQRRVALPADAADLDLPDRCGGRRVPRRADSHTTPRGQVIPLGLACRASLAEHLDAEDITLITRQGLDFFTGLFQGDYPFAKYDQVFVPEYSAGATENVGCVVISDELLFRSRVTDAHA